jgi:hypothetical protein
MYLSVTLSEKFVAAVNDTGERFVVDIVNVLPFSTTPATINNPATPSLIYKFFLLKYYCSVYKLRIYMLGILPIIKIWIIHGVRDFQ